MRSQRRLDKANPEKSQKGHQIVYRSTLSNRLPGAPLNSGWQ